MSQLDSYYVAMAFTFEDAATNITEMYPQDRGARWLAGRLSWVAGGREKLSRKFLAGDPDAARVHRLLFAQYAHLRDCPVFPSQEPYSHASRQAALDLAEQFAQATELPTEVIQDNWATIIDNVYPGEQEKVNTPKVRVYTE